MGGQKSRILFYPKNLNDVLRIFSQARENNLSIKCYGGTYPVSEDGDVVISLLNLKRIIWYDPNEQILTVEAGVTLREILTCIEYFNGTLELYGTLPNMTIADAVSVGLIGSAGTIANCLKACQIVSLDGKVIECTWPCQDHVVCDDVQCAGDNNIYPTLQHLVCGLGAVGLITTITLQCIPIHLAQQVTYTCTSKEILSISKRISKVLYSEIQWYPLISKVLVTNHHIVRLHQGFYQPIWKRAMENFYLLFHWIVRRVSPYIVSFVPELSYHISNIQFDLMLRASVFRTGFCFKPQKFVGVEMYCKGIKWSIPTENISTLIEDIENWAECHRHLCSTPIIMCFQVHKNMDICKPLLSPYTEESMCTIWTDWFSNKNLEISYSAEMAEFESLLQKSFGRKCWSAGPVFTSPLIGQMYPGFKHWCYVKSVLDPELTFRSPYVEGDLIGEHS